MPKSRSLALLILAIALVAAACSSDASDTPETTTTTLATESLEHEMCRTLKLLDTGRVPASLAAVSMETVDLTDADSQERAAYGNLLVSAPRNQCPALTAYADVVAYWLGY